MAENNVEITFGANIEGARGEIEKLKAAIESFAAPIRSAIESFKELDGASKGLQSPGGRPSTEATKIAIAQFQTQSRLADISYRQTLEQLNAAVRLHEISYDQETAALRRALDQRKAAQDAVNTAELAANADNALAYEKYVGQRKIIDAKYRAERQKILDQALAHDAQEWQSALQPLQSAWDSQLRKLLSGGESFGQAMKHVFADLVLDAIKQFEKLALQQASVGIASTFGGPQSALSSLLGGGGQAAATAANTTALTTLTAALTANTAALGGQAAAEAAAGAGSATSLFSGFFKLFSIFGFDAGTDYVLNSGLAIIHQGETIVPARGTGPFTGAGLAGGGDTHNWNISAVDAPSFQRWLGSGGAQQIARAVSGVQARSPSMSW
jgi:hypothetical protein